MNQSISRTDRHGWLGLTRLLLGGVVQLLEILGSLGLAVLQVFHPQVSKAVQHLIRVRAAKNKTKKKTKKRKKKKQDKFGGGRGATQG